MKAKVYIVDKSIKPIHHTKRATPELQIGSKYFVSFGSNKELECTLKEIHLDTLQRRVTVELSDSGTNYLYADELGNTPEQAVINEVTL